MVKLKKSKSKKIIIDKFFDFFKIIKKDLTKLYKNFSASLKNESDLKSKLLSILNNFSELLIKTKIFIISLVIFIPIIFSLFQTSSDKLFVIDEQSLSTCIQETFISANTIPSKGISRAKAKEILNSVYLRNPKKTPDNIAKFAYKIIKNDRKKGLEKLLASQLLIALKIKIKNVKIF